jgi:hypothetical protein
LDTNNNVLVAKRLYPAIRFLVEHTRKNEKRKGERISPCAEKFFCCIYADTPFYSNLPWEGLKKKVRAKKLAPTDCKQILIRALSSP